MTQQFLNLCNVRAILHQGVDVWFQQLEKSGVADEARMLLELEFHIFGSVKYQADHSQAYYKVSSQEGLGDGYDDIPRFNIHKGYHRIYPQDRYFNLRNEIVTTLASIGIPVKYHHHETGAAQHEIELDFLPLTEAADKVTLAKWIIRNIVRDHGLHATFMPKPLYGLPGNGLHVHQYLEKGGHSIFAGDSVYGLSPTALSYLCGLLEHSLSGSMLAFTNPSTNSYKRLVPGYEAPVAATFARASRESSIRIPGYLRKGDERIEYRTGDASANVHYMLSAMVLAGLDGIARGADPVARGFNNPDKKQVFPLNLHRVLDGLLADSGYLQPIFSKEFVELWVGVKRAEAYYVYRAPTAQEYELYF